DGPRQTGERRTRASRATRGPGARALAGARHPAARSARRFRAVRSRGTNLGGRGPDRGCTRGHGSHPAFSRAKEAPRGAGEARARMSTKDWLERATRELRDAGVAPPAEVAATRARLMDTLTKRERRRTRAVVLLLPIAAMLAGGAAFAKNAAVVRGVWDQ